MNFEVVVIGSGPAGQKAAIQAAKAGKRVAVIERDRKVGGSCVHTDTIPSKSLREHALRQRVRKVNLFDEPIQSLLDGVDKTVAAPLGLLVPSDPVSRLPSGVYTIPEIATVGLDEAGARKHFGGAIVGRARFEEIARGQINGCQQGLLKLVADRSTSMLTSTTFSTFRRWPRRTASRRSTS